MSTIRNKKDPKDLHDKDSDRFQHLRPLNHEASRLLNIDETAFQYVLTTVDLHDKDSDRLLNIDETGFQYVLTTVMRTGAESRDHAYKVQKHNIT